MRVKSRAQSEVQNNAYSLHADAKEPKGRAHDGVMGSKRNPK